MQEKVLIAVYHKDRVNFLKNLLDSLEKNIKFKKIKFEIIIFDSSTKFKNIEFLKSISNYKVYFNKAIIKNTLGNLYESMNITLKICNRKKINYFFTIQDDMQLIREIHDSDYLYLKNIFQNSTKILSCNLSFLRKINCLDFTNIFLNYKRDYYINFKSAYADSAFFSCKVLNKLKFNFKKGEDINDKYYLKKGYKSIYMIYPVLHYLPWGETARIGRFDNSIVFQVIKKILVKLNKLGTNSKLHKIKLKQKKYFFNRNKKVLPTDELFLDTSEKLLLPWAYDPIWSLSKFKDIKKLIFLDWVFNGSIDYIFLKKKIKKNNLINTKIFYAKNKYIKL